MKRAAARRWYRGAEAAGYGHLGASARGRPMPRLFAAGPRLGNALPRQCHLVSRKEMSPCALHAGCQM